MVSGSCTAHVFLIAKYEKLAEQFNPVKFNAAEWVSLAKAAGQEAHGDHVKSTTMASAFSTSVRRLRHRRPPPFGRDPLKELAEVRQAGSIKLGFTIPGRGLASPRRRQR